VNCTMYNSPKEHHAGEQVVNAVEQPCTWLTAVHAVDGYGSHDRVEIQRLCDER